MILQGHIETWGGYGLHQGIQRALAFGMAFCDDEIHRFSTTKRDSRILHQRPSRRCPPLPPMSEESNSTLRTEEREIRSHSGELVLADSPMHLSGTRRLVNDGEILQVHHWGSRSMGGRYGNILSKGKR